MCTQANCLSFHSRAFSFLPQNNSVYGKSFSIKIQVLLVLNLLSSSSFVDNVEVLTQFYVITAICRLSDDKKWAKADQCWVYFIKTSKTFLKMKILNFNWCRALQPYCSARYQKSSQLKSCNKNFLSTTLKSIQDAQNSTICIQVFKVFSPCSQRWLFDEVLMPKTC